MQRARVVRRARFDGTRTYRTVGEPDFYIFGDRGRYWLIECKRKGGKQSIEQKGVEMQLARLGHGYFVVRSLEEFLELVGPRS